MFFFLISNLIAHMCSIRAWSLKCWKMCQSQMKFICFLASKFRLRSWGKAETRAHGSWSKTTYFSLSVFIPILAWIIKEWKKDWTFLLMLMSNHSNTFLCCRIFRSKIQNSSLILAWKIKEWRRIEPTSHDLCLTYTLPLWWRRDWTSYIWVQSFNHISMVPHFQPYNSEYILILAWIIKEWRRDWTHRPQCQCV